MEFNQTIYEKIDAYIFDRLTAEEKSLFEKEMEDNQELKEEVRFTLGIKSSISGKDWLLFDEEIESDQVKHISQLKRSEKYASIAADLETIGNEYFETLDQKPKTRNKFLYIAGAAAIAMLLFVGYYFSSNQSTDKLYATYNDWQELPSLTLQGDDQAILAKGEAFFGNNEYEEAITVFSTKLDESIQNKQQPHPYILAYLGASYLGLDNYDKALNIFDRLLESNTLDNSRGYWYKAMVYLKQGNREEAINTLKLLLENKTNFNFDKAQELLKKLE